MDLRDFIFRSIEEVLHGVEDAREKYPSVVAYWEGNKEFPLKPTPIEFEVNVTVEEGAKGGLKVWGIAELGGDMSTSQANKITFSVPVYLGADLKGEK